MQRFTKAHVCILGLSFLQSAGFASTGAKQEIAVVVSAKAEQLNAATIEFYQSVVNTIQRERVWKLSATEDVRHFLSRARQPLETLPSIARQDFVKSHPEANFPRASDKKSGKNQMNTSLQVMLDSLALQGVIVADCLPDGNTWVKGCGIYYYERASGRVVASAQKSFAAGVPDATRWASPLVARLNEGIKSVQSQKEKDKIDAMMNKEDESVANKILLSAGIQGENAAPTGAGVGYIPELLLGLGYESDGMAVSLEGQLGETRKRDSVATTVVATRSLGAGVQVTSRALDHLIWGLTVGSGVAQRTETYATEDDESRLAAREFYVCLRPAMFFEINPKTRIGSEFSWKRFIGGNADHDGDHPGALASEAFPSQAVGLAFTLQRQF